jgi:integrase
MLVDAEVRVLEIQTKLHRWATNDPHRRFDDLFNLVVDPAFLVVAWERVRGNKGAKTRVRLRLVSGLSIATGVAGVQALTHFSEFLAEAARDVSALADIDRPLLERYLAWLAARPGGPATRARWINALHLFFQAIRQYNWDATLPTTATFFVGDCPPRPPRLSRHLAEYVMAQVEQPANLDRWPDPAHRLVTLLLIRCGLRVSDACTLRFDCLVHDGQRAPYLRYINNKMKREAAVPIDEELESAIHAQQRRVMQRWPDGNPNLFPRQKANASGQWSLAADTYRNMLESWLRTCDVRDEHGRRVHLTAHQWRHTFATRLINRDVPQEVIRVLLDHESMEMTSHYANQRSDSATALGTGRQGEHQRRARKHRPRRTARPSAVGQDPLRHRHPDTAARLLRPAGAEELPARQRPVD